MATTPVKQDAAIPRTPATPASGSANKTAARVSSSILDALPKGGTPLSAGRDSPASSIEALPGRPSMTDFSSPQPKERAETVDLEPIQEEQVIKRTWCCGCNCVTMLVLFLIAASAAAAIFTALNHIPTYGYGVAGVILFAAVLVAGTASRNHRRQEELGRMETNDTKQSAPTPVFQQFLDSIRGKPASLSLVLCITQKKFVEQVVYYCRADSENIYVKSHPTAQEEPIPLTSDNVLSIDIRPVVKPNIPTPYQSLKDKVQFEPSGDKMTLRYYINPTTHRKVIWSSGEMWYLDIKPLGKDTVVFRVCGIGQDIQLLNDQPTRGSLAR